MSTACPICIKLVLDSDEGVCCDADCERWFHRECLRMPKSEYQRICSDNNIKWECSRTDCKRVTVDPIDSKLDAILSKLSSLATKEELSDGLNLIKQDLQIVSSKLKELEPRLAQVESEIKSIKANATAGDELYEDLISECNDRKRRSRNVIIHKLTEVPISSSAREVKQHDVGLVTDFLRHVNSNVQISEVRYYRLGKKLRDNTRPLVVCMPSEEAAVHIFKKFSSNDVPVNLQGISISHDRTLRERKHLEQLRAALKSRHDAGETNLTIKFVNGTPKIVSKN